SDAGRSAVRLGRLADRVVDVGGADLAGEAVLVELVADPRVQFDERESDSAGGQLRLRLSKRIRARVVDVADGRARNHERPKGRVGGLDEVRDLGREARPVGVVEARPKAI